MSEVDISHFPELRDRERIAARELARTNLIAKQGRKPERGDFKDYAASKFPRWFSLPIALILLTVGLSAASISMFRIYYAGRDYFLEAIPVPWMAELVGVSTFLAAELLVIVAAIGARVYLSGREQLVAFVPISIGLLVAFVGNWHIAQPHSLWGWLDTLFPPTAVLSVAWFFERALLPELERRQANEVAYQEALKVYYVKIGEPENHPDWLDAYGWALWDVWAKTFQRRKAIDVAAITREERRAIVAREMEHDTFWGEISGNSLDFRRKRMKAGGDQSKQPRERVLEYLKDNPDAVHENQAETAEFLGVSPATVNRAIKAFSENGHQEE